MLSWLWEKADYLIRRNKSTNPFIIANNCNYYVRYENMPFWGHFIRVSKRTGVITINPQLSKNKKFFVGGHELAHGVLEHDNRFDDERMLKVRWYNMIKEERLANLFSAHLMCKDYDWSHGDLHLASKETGVSLYVLQEYVFAKGIDKLVKQNHQRKRISDKNNAFFYYNYHP